MSPRLAGVPSLAGPPRPSRPAIALAEVQGTLALELGAVRPAPSSPRLPEYDPSTTARLPSTLDAQLRPWAARFAQAVVEALGGDRPVTQLVRWTSRAVYADLDRRAQVVATVRGARSGRMVRPQVRSLHVFQPSPSTAEISVHVRHGERSRALAARLEQRSGRWVCTALELG